MRIAKQPPLVVQTWMNYLQNSLRARRVNRAHVGEDTLVRFAAYLTLIGGPSDEQAVKVYSSLVQLLLSWRRVQHLSSNLNFLPTSVEGLQRVSRAVLAAELVEKVENAVFPLNHFIGVATQLPDARAYVDVCRKDLPTIRAIFHPNTLRFISERYRGVVGDLANPEYRDEIKKKVRTVS